MCMGKTPEIQTPPPVQEVKQPQVSAVADKARRNRSSAAMGGSSLLTGPTGVAAVSTGRSTLLGQ